MTEFITVAERNKRKKIADAEAILKDLERRLFELDDRRITIVNCITTKKDEIAELKGEVQVVVEKLEVPLSFKTMNTSETYNDLGSDIVESD